MFCGSDINLTYAMKHFFPDSFHKVRRQRVKTNCLNLSVESNQQLVERWCPSGNCLVPHHVLVSAGLAENLTGHLHSEVVTGGLTVFHPSMESIWCESDSQIACIPLWLRLFQNYQFFFELMPCSPLQL